MELAIQPSFNENAWRELCESYAKSACRRCGCSDGLYEQLFSQDIDMELNKIPMTHLSRALRIADEFGYQTTGERDRDQQWNADHGYCTHGIQFGCCPAGCE